MRINRILAVLICIIISGLVLYLHDTSYSLERSYIDEQCLQKVEATNELATAKLQARLEDSVSVIQAAVNQIPCSNGKIDNVKDSLTKLDELLVGYGFSQVALSNTNGEAVLSDNSKFSIKENLEFEKTLTGNVAISYHGFNETYSQATVVFTVPIVKENVVSGILYASWNADQLEEILSTSDYRGREEVALLDRHSIILYALSDSEITGSNLLNQLGEKNELYGECEQIIKQGRYFTASVKNSEAQNLIISYMGIRKLSDWGIVTIVNKEDIIEILSLQTQILSRRIIIGVICTFIIMLAVLLIYQGNKRYRLEMLAYMDHVTKSYNFKGFMKRSNDLFENNPISKFAILEVTLEKLDYYEEMFGNEAVNQVLRYMSSKIQTNIHTEEAFCRYNTTNFLIMMKYENIEELESRIEYLLEKINNDEGAVGNEKFELNSRAGVCCFEDKLINIDKLIYQVTLALEEAMKSRMCPYYFYKDSMEELKSESRELEEDMMEALKAGEFTVFLQPIFSLEDGRQTGAEALVRWRHPEKGILYPGKFLYLFERNGAMPELDLFIFEELCRYLKVWIRKGIKPLPLSFNVSIYSLYNGEFIDKIASIAESYGVPENLICLEIEEKAIMNNIELVKDVLARMQEKGFLIAMDDFGVGSMSMNTLYEAHIDILKIDRRFLIDSEKTDRGKSIINSIVDISKRLKIKVAAIGVDNKLQARMLREFGCDMIQGFVFSEPLPEREYEEYAYGSQAGENKVAV